MNGIEQNTSTVGVVIIGRNEGDRLKRCLDSIDLAIIPVVYVDSGSTDGSLSLCRGLGLPVVNLDMSSSFTAARARNAGFDRLIQLRPKIQYVQFLDGDCQLDASWIATAIRFLEDNPPYAAACGRRREVSPGASIYNRLCDIEWNTPVGDAKSCGGDVLIRARAFREIEGFLPSLIAGEEPELCYRLRQSGWKIMRLDAEMTGHDAHMTRFPQWWRRSKRAGYACCLGVLLHGRAPERYYVKPFARMLFWGGLLPLAIAILTLVDPRLLALIAIYPLQYIRLAAKGPVDFGGNLVWAAFTLFAKFPQFAGIMHCLRDQYGHRTSAIIEYK